jgi:hypothetical protein
VRRFASQAADRLDGTAKYLDDRHVQDIVADLEKQTKANPVPFLLGAVALGFLAGRMLRRH